MRILSQLLRWSLVGWVLMVVITGIYLVTTDRAFTDVVFGGALFASVCLLGIGAMSLGGGGIAWTDPTSRGVRRLERDRWDEEGAMLTPFGAALLVIPQLLGGAVLIGGLAS